MKVKSIKVGYTIPGTNYDNFRIDYQADLEPWEDEQQTILFLRRKCLEAAKDAGFNINKYLPDDEIAEMLSEKNKESKKRLKAVREEFEAICKENEWYQKDLEDIRTVTRSIKDFNDYRVEAGSRQLQIAIERLAERHPNLFKDGELPPQMEKESEVYDPIPFEDKDESFQEEEEEDEYF